MEMIDGNGLTHATYHWREREVGGCGDKCPNGTECPHPSHGADHPDKADATAFHEYAVRQLRHHFWDRFSRISQPHTNPHAPWAAFLLVPILIGSSFGPGIHAVTE